MSNQVYANTMEVACKAADGKSICAMPDVCMTPPQTPATPPGVPIPYPNTGMASDCSDGSSTVQISGQEVLLKDKSFFKKSTGDEAGSAPLKGVLTQQNTGKVYFAAWSMDVQFEGENVVRHLDLTTHNCASVPANTGPWPYLDQMTMSSSDPCRRDAAKVNFCCSGDHDKDCKNDDCKNAKKCMLVPKEPTKGQPRCCDGHTGHHLIEVHCFTPVAGRNAGSVLSGFEGYNQDKAPCVCVVGGRESGEHGQFHSIQQRLEVAFNSAPGESETFVGWEEKGLKDRTTGVRGPAESNWKYEDARNTGEVAMQMVFPECDRDCVRKQLDNYHKQPEPDGPGVGDHTPVRSDTRPGIENTGGPLSSTQQNFLDTLSGAVESTATA